MEKMIVDRFEGDYAVVEFGELMFDVPRQCLPEETKEGDTVRIILESNISARKNKYDSLFEE